MKILENFEKSKLLVSHFDYDYMTVQKANLIK